MWSLATGAWQSSDLEEIIRERENDFFRDLAADDQSTRAHPLLHMVASQQKLASIGVPHRHARVEAKQSPYEREQILVENIGRASTTRCQKPQPADARSRRRLKHRKDEDDFDRGKVSSSARKHRQFLSESLRAVHEQLETTTVSPISATRTVSDCSDDSRRVAKDGPAGVGMIAISDR